MYSRTVSTARGVDVDSTSKQSRGRHAGEAKFMEEDMFGIPLLRLQGGSGYRQSSWPSWRPFREPYWAASPSGEGTTPSLAAHRWSPSEQVFPGSKQIIAILGIPCLGYWEPHGQGIGTTLTLNSLTLAAWILHAYQRALGLP